MILQHRLGVRAWLRKNGERIPLEVVWKAENSEE